MLTVPSKTNVDGPQPHGGHAGAPDHEVVVQLPAGSPSPTRSTETPSMAPPTPPVEMVPSVEKVIRPG